MLSEGKETSFFTSTPPDPRGALEYLHTIRSFEGADLHNAKTTSESDLVRIASDHQTLCRLATLLYGIIPSYVKECPEYGVPKKEDIEQNPAALYRLANRLFEELPNHSIDTLSIDEKDTLEAWRYLLYNVLGNCSESILNSTGIFYTVKPPTLDQQSDIAKNSLRLMENDTPVIERLFLNLPTTPRIVRTVSDIERIIEKNSFHKEKEDLSEKPLLERFSFALNGKLMKIFFQGLGARVLDRFKKRNKSREEDLQKKHTQKVFSLWRSFLFNVVPPVMGAFALIQLKIPFLPAALFGSALFYCLKFLKNRIALGDSGTSNLTALEEGKRRVNIVRSPTESAIQYTGEIESRDKNFYQKMCVSSPMVVLDGQGNLQPLHAFVDQLPANEKQILQNGLYNTRILNFDGDNSEKELEEGETSISLVVENIENFSVPLPVNYSIASLDVYLGTGDNRALFPAFEKHITECRLGGAQVQIPLGIFRSRASVRYTIRPTQNADISSEVQEVLNHVLPRPTDLKDEPSKDIDTAIRIAGTTKDQKIPILFRNFSRGMVYSKDRVTGSILSLAKGNLYDAIRGVRSGTCDVFAFGLNQLFRFHEIPSVVIHGYNSKEQLKAFIASGGHAQNCVIKNGQVEVLDVTKKAAESDPFGKVGWLKKVSLPYLIDYRAPDAIYKGSAHSRNLDLNLQKQKQADVEEDSSIAALVDDVLLFERVLLKYKETLSFEVLNQWKQCNYNTKDYLSSRAAVTSDDPRMQFFTEYNFYSRFCQTISELAVHNIDINRLFQDANSFFSYPSNVYSEVSDYATFCSIRDLIKTFGKVELKDNPNSSQLANVAMFLGSTLLKDESSDLTNDDAKILLKFVQQTVESGIKTVGCGWTIDYSSILLQVAKKFPNLQTEIIECADTIFCAKKNHLSTLMLDMQLFLTIQDQSLELSEEIISRWVKYSFEKMASRLTNLTKTTISPGQEDVRECIDFDIFKIDNLKEYSAVSLEVQNETFEALKQIKVALKNTWEDWGFPDIESPIKRYCLQVGDLHIRSFYQLVYELKKNDILTQSEVDILLPEISEEDLVKRKLSKINFLSLDRDPNSEKEIHLLALAYPLTLHCLLSRQLSKQVSPNLIANNYTILALCALQVAQNYGDTEPKLFMNDVDPDDRQQDIALYQVLKKYQSYDFSYFNDPKRFEAFLMEHMFFFSQSKEAYIGELVRGVLKRNNILQEKESSLMEDIQKLSIFSTEDILDNPEQVKSAGIEAIRKVIPTWNEVLYGSLPLPVQLRFIAPEKSFPKQSDEQDLLYYLINTPIPEVEAAHPSADRINEKSKICELEMPFFGKWEFGSIYSDAWFDLMIRFPLIFAPGSNSVNFESKNYKQSKLRTVATYSTNLDPRKKIRHGGDDEFDRLITYERGMDARRINFKASARASSLKVNHFEDLKEHGTTFLIDIEWLADSSRGHNDIFENIENLFEVIQNTIKSRNEVNLIFAVRGAYYNVPNVARLFSNSNTTKEFFDSVAVLCLKTYQTAIAESSLERETSVAPIDKLSLVKLSAKFFKNRRIVLGISDIHKPSFTHSIGWLKGEASELRILN